MASGNSDTNIRLFYYYQVDQHHGQLRDLQLPCAVKGRVGIAPLPRRLPAYCRRTTAVEKRPLLRGKRDFRFSPFAIRPQQSPDTVDAGGCCGLQNPSIASIVGVILIVIV